MKYNYQIDLIIGNHGIWLFVNKNGKLVYEQAGLDNIDNVLARTKAVIEYEEKQVE